MLLSIKLLDERVVWLRRIYIAETYECLLEGKPSSRTNEFVLQSYSVTAQRIWPGIPIQLLGREIYAANLGAKLPRLIYCGYFYSPNPARESTMIGSQLILSWFQDELSPLLSSKNNELLKRFDWTKLAQDFDVS